MPRVRYSNTGSIQTNRRKTRVLLKLFPKAKDAEMRSNVLVVMDIKPDRLTTTGLSLLNEALCSFGCNSVVARDSDDALRILSQDNISAVLCTVGLYNGTAFDLLQAAKAQKLVTMPFIVETVSQTPIQDQILNIGCESTGAIYFNMGNYDSTEEMRQELKKRLLRLDEQGCSAV